MFDIPFKTTTYTHKRAEGTAEELLPKKKKHRVDQAAA